MKTKIGFLALLVLSACNGGGASAPLAKSTLDVAPAPSPSVSPSPSPSPSATPYAYSGGDGTVGTPYVLSVAEDVQRIGENPAAYFSMNQSINMGGTNFTPIASFSGTLFGNGFELDNLTIVENTTATAAMFLTMSGTITNVKIYGASVTGQGLASVIAGSLTGRLSFVELTGTVTSTLGGNGYSSGVGRPSYVTKSGATFISNTQDVYFNGNHINGVLN